MARGLGYAPESLHERSQTRMSWTIVRGHRPVGPRYRERPLGDPEDALIDVPQKCTCGELYDCEHVAALVID